MAPQTLARVNLEEAWVSFAPKPPWRDFLTYFTFFTNVGVRGGFGIYSNHTWQGSISSPCCNGEINVVSLRIKRAHADEVTRTPTCTECGKQVLPSSENAFNDIGSPGEMVSGMGEFLALNQDAMAAQILAVALADRLELFTHTFTLELEKLRGRSMRNYAENITVLRRKICGDLSDLLILK